MQRIIAVDTLRKLMKDTASDDRTIVEAWHYLQSLGGHPTAEPLAPHLEWRERRQKLFVKLRELVQKRPDPPTLEYDRKLLETWEDNYFDGHERFQEITTERKAATGRLKKLRDYLAVVDQCTLESEKKLAAALTALPQSYHPKLRERSRTAMRRLKALQKLQQAMQEGSDIHIIEAQESLAAAEGQSLLTDEQKQRIELAVRRQPLLEQLAQVSHNWPPNELDNKLLEVWDEALLSDCKDAAQWLPTYQRARQRKIVVEKLEAAIEALDLAAIDQLMAEQCLRRYPLPSDITQGIEHAKERFEQQQLSRRQALITALMEADRGVFAELFNARTLGEICEQYRHHQAVVSRMVENEILPLAKSGLAKPDGDALARDEEDEAVYIARWTWPPPKFAAACRLIVCQSPPPKHGNPEDVQAVYSVAITRAQWEADGGHHKITTVPQWANFHVLVWFNIDLGFQSYYSEPLELGTLVPAKKQKRWGLFG